MSGAWVCEGGEYCVIDVCGYVDMWMRGREVAFTDGRTGWLPVLGRVSRRRSIDTAWSRIYSLHSKISCLILSEKSDCSETV